MINTVLFVMDILGTSRPNYDESENHLYLADLCYYKKKRKLVLATCLNNPQCINVILFYVSSKQRGNINEIA